MASNPKRLQDVKIKEKPCFSGSFVIHAHTSQKLGELLLDIEQLCEKHEAKFEENTLGLDY